MAQSSFDVTTGVDLQEVDNAVNQAQKEIAQRYDFKGSIATIEFSRAEGTLNLTAESEFRMQALFDVLQGRLIKRGVPVKNLDIGEIKPAGGDKVTHQVKLKMALDGDTAKKSPPRSRKQSSRKSRPPFRAIRCACPRHRETIFRPQWRCCARRTSVSS